MPKTVTVKIDRFLGLHIDAAGDTNLKVGELSECKNIRIIENYKARKREGYEQLFATISSNKKIRGMWYGKIGSTNYFLFACNGNVYTLDLVNKTYTSIGTLTDATTTFFAFSNKVYILNGNDYYSWNGTGSIATVSGYRPLVATATPPAGGGTALEEINVLTGAKAQKFSGDNVATNYFLAEAAITSVDYVKVGGVTKTVTTDYTVDLTAGKVTFVVAPATGTNNVDIGWTKGSGTRSIVTENKYSLLFGGANDSRVFLYGDASNVLVYSGLANGVPSAEYFPASAYNQIGSDDSPITYVTKQYDRQIIYTSSKAYYSTYQYDTTLGTSFSVYPLNDALGNTPYGQGQLLLNNPFTIYKKTLYQWTATNVRDEKNAMEMSQRVQTELDALDLSTAITIDYERETELWIAVGTTVYIYNYQRDVWYKFILAHTPTCFLTVDNTLYFGTTNGQIMAFGDLELTDNGTAIAAVMETGFIDFGKNWIRKFLNFVWVGLQPEAQSKCEIEWQSDYSASSASEVITYNLISYENLDYSDFTYDLNYNPQPFRLKLKSKKFTYFKLILSNDSSDQTMTILNVTMPALLGGQAK